MELEIEIMYGELVINLIDNSQPGYCVIARGAISLDELKEALDDGEGKHK